MNHIKILCASFTVLLLLSTTGVRAQDTAQTSYLSKNETENLIGALQQNCDKMLPGMICACLIDTLKDEATQSHYKIQKQDIDKKVERIGSECTFSSGYVRSMMDKASAFCYTEDPASIRATHIDIEALKKKHPEKVRSCSCFQESVNAMDEKVFWQASMAAYQRYKNRANCLKHKDKEACWKEFPDDPSSVLKAAENKCGS